MARFCPHCSAAAESDWRFCQACGKTLPGAVAGALDSRDQRVADVWKRAQLDLEMNDLEAAERTVSDLMDLGCDTGDVLALRAAISLRGAKMDEAIELLDRAVEESPMSPFVRLKRADYWRALGMNDLAIQELQEGMRRSDSERVRNDLRVVLAKLKKDSRWSFARASPFSRSK
ncbi:MAG: hypothetical protein ABI559_07195 [Chloroflexota bacterium]